MHKQMNQQQENSQLGVQLLSPRTTSAIEVIDSQIAAQKINIAQQAQKVLDLQKQLQFEETVLKEEKKNLLSLQYERSKIFVQEHKHLEIVQYASKILFSTGTFAHVNGVRVF